MPRPAVSAAIVGTVVGFALMLPLLGASLIAVLLVERLFLRRMPATRVWLGLGQSESA
jgi:uncharacterized iron-regulated membrane protein